MKNNVRFFHSGTCSFLISLAIGALFVCLFSNNYFPNVSLTLWIAVAVSILMLGINVFSLNYIHHEDVTPANWYVFYHWVESVIGEVATISVAMLALSCHLNIGSKSALVLLFLSATFFAFQMLQQIAYVQCRLRCA